MAFGVKLSYAVMPSQFSPLRTPAQSLQEYGRGLAGGLIFSLPLLFTMEVWQASFTFQPGRLALYMAMTLAVLLLYNRFAGLRDDSASWWECAIDSVEEMGLGLVLAAFMLWLCGRLDAPASWLEIGGMIVMGGMTVAIGVSVGTAQLGASQNESSDESEDEGAKGEKQSEEREASFLSQMALAFCGAILIAANIAPTEEVLVVAEETAPFKLLLMALCSLVGGAYVLFFAEFRGSSDSTRDPLRRARLVISTYAVALAASASTLFFFGRFDGESWRLCLSQIVVVSMAATLGASAGRLLLQSDGNSA